MRKKVFDDEWCVESLRAEKNEYDARFENMLERKALAEMQKDEEDDINGLQLVG